MNEMTFDEFHKLGYLQELNRQFLHPLGLSIAIRIDEDGSKHFHAILDHRADEAGAVFPSNVMDKKKAAYIEKQMNERSKARLDVRGFIVQPID